MRKPKLPDWNWRASPLLVAIFALGLFAASFSLAPHSRFGRPRENQQTQTVNNALPEHRRTPESADDRVADYTFWLEIFTGLLVVVGALQGFLIWRQFRLGRDEFVTTHRPRIRVRFVENQGQSTDGIQTAQVFFVNVGETPATIVHLTSDILLRDPATKHWHSPGLGAQVTADRKIVAKLACGEGVALWIKGRRPLTPLQENGLKYDQLQMFAIGVVVYWDDLKTERRTGYIWKLDTISQRFVPTNPTDEYEYAYED